MNARLLLIIAAFAVTSTAQTPKPKAPAPSKTTTAKPQPKPVTPVAKPNSTPGKPATTRSQSAAKPSPASKPAPMAPEVARTGRRDPFISPVRLQEERMKSNPACTTGARCLVISQVVLKGVVKTQSGMIAMVENAAKKQYNLREKDAVQNGLVLKITGDSVVFQESVTDPLGRPVTREVVKRVTAPVV